MAIQVKSVYGRPCFATAGALRIRRLTVAATEVVSIDNARSASSGLLLTVASEDAILAVWPCCGFYLLPFGAACCRRNLSQTSTCNSCSHFPSHSWTSCRRCHRCCDMPYSAWNCLHFPATDSHLSSVAETSTFVSSGRMWCHECFSILQ